MWFDIPWIAGPMGVGNISSSVSGANNLAKAGRVVRLVRLVRLVKLFKIAGERRKRARHEEEMMELVAIGAIAYEDIAKQTALTSERKSKLGGELSESTTRRVIVIVLVMVCILPLLAAPTSNLGPDYALQLVQTMQIAAQQGLVSSAVLNENYEEIIDALHSKNGENYMVYFDLQSNGKSVLMMQDASKLANIRDAAKFELESTMRAQVSGQQFTSYVKVSPFCLQPSYIFVPPPS